MRGLRGDNQRRRSVGHRQGVAAAHEIPDARVRRSVGQLRRTHVNADHGIATEAWSPIAQGDVLDDPVLKKIAEEKGKSTAQVTLRWHIQRGDIIFPKSVTRSRVEENFDIFDFELSGDDVAAIDGLNKNKRRGPDPDTFNYVP